MVTMALKSLPYVKVKQKRIKRKMEKRMVKTKWKKNKRVKSKKKWPNLLYYKTILGSNDRLLLAICWINLDLLRLDLSLKVVIMLQRSRKLKVICYLPVSLALKLT